MIYLIVLFLVLSIIQLITRPDNQFNLLDTDIITIQNNFEIRLTAGLTEMWSLRHLAKNWESPMLKIVRECECVDDEIQLNYVTDVGSYMFENWSMQTL